MRTLYGQLSIGLLCVLSVAAEAETTTLEAGTTIYARLMENVHSSFNTQGETVEMRAAEAIMIDGMVVIEEGALIEAAIGSVHGTGMVGKSGNVSFHPVRIAAADGQWVPLDPTDFGAQGEGPGAGAIFAVGIFAKGRPGFVPRGTQYTVTVRRDTEVAVDAGSPATELPHGEVLLSGSFDAIPVIKSKRTKPGRAIGLELDVPSDLASAVMPGENGVEIVSFDDYVPERSVRSTGVELDESDNTLSATFDWWSVVRNVPAGDSEVVVQMRLADGRLAQANLVITTDWDID